MVTWTTLIASGGAVLLEALTEAVVVVNAAGHIVFVNQAATQMLGYQKAELLGQPVELLVPETLRSRHVQHRIRYGEQPQPYTLLSRTGLFARRKDGSHVPIAYSLSPLPTSEGLYVIAMLTDLTEWQRLEAQLRQAQRLETLGLLAGGIAHDFNNRLTTIQGYMDLLRFSLPEEVAASVQSYLQEIQLAADQAAHLTQQLLLFSRQQPLSRQVIDWNHHLRRLERMLQRLLGEDIQVRFVLADALWPVWADPGNLDQIVLNLAVNARDAMPQGGQLIIRTENVDIDEEYCREHTYARPGSYVCLTVQDTGVGMSDQVRAHLFDPFFTTKPVGKGTGLGLAVVYGIVKDHQGWITVESQLGQGSTFRIYLPARQRLEVSPREEEASSFVLEQFPGHGEQILVVEDADQVRAVITQTLQTAGYVVITATTATEARALFAQHASTIALVISDVVLPDGRGVELVAEWRTQQPQLPILLISGYTDDRSEWRRISQMQIPLLHKPFGITDLLRQVHDLLRARA